MSRIQQYQSSFTVGELDPLLRGRIDLQQYYSSVDVADNVIFEPQGGFSRRPGLKFLLDITSDNAANGTVLIPFEFSTTQNFMILASAQNTTSTIRFRFFANATLLTNINSTGNDYLDYSVGTLYEVSNFDMSKLYFTQSADTLIMTHENFAPFKIVRGANNTTWTASALSLTIPKLATSLSTTNPLSTITPSAVDGTIKITSSNSQFGDAMVDQYINALNDFGRARITRFISATVVEAVTEVPFFNTDGLENTNSTSPPTLNWEVESGHEDAWSNTRGWPRTCSFHEGRLYFGGSATFPNTLFASKVSDFFNFKPAEALDDDAIIVTLSTDSVNAINALRSGRDLQIFTSGAEFFVPQADLDPITPSNITVKSATRRGSKFGIRPQAAEGGTLFIQRQGKALREMLFSDVELSYVANNISLLSSHMIVDPHRMALRPATDTTEGDLLLIVNGSSSTGYRADSAGFTGTIAAFMLNRPQQIVAPSSFTTDGDFVDVGVDQEDIYVVVKRTISSSTKYYLEVFDDDRTTDAAIQYYNSPSSPDQALPGSTTAGSLSHLEGKTVKIIRDDIVDTDATVSSGQVTMGGVPTSYAEVGINYNVTVKTQPFEPRLSSGTVQGQRRRILEVTPILHRSQNLTLNGREISLQTLPLSGSGAVPTFTGIKKTQGFLGYDRDAQITISQSQPVFFTVLAMDYKVSIGQ
ncbi:MAG: hypothetical protein CMQ13_08275 [Gammaproteobacteria bacterium]|nr:hypothetical protein [Gammaproteobacteria bacterium]|tara:strand:+ start:1719 stop:3815 length:2097 start_codon:yes stop_codon:yes gene_type:complete